MELEEFHRLLDAVRGYPLDPEQLREPPKTEWGKWQKRANDKTAALITAAIVGGATLAGAAEPDRERLRRFGFGVGVAFQIADDLLDAGEDVCSLVDAVGEEAARARGELLLESALAEIATFGAGSEPLRALALFALRRKE